MTATSIEAPFTLRRVQAMLGLSRTTLTRLIAAGFVSPVRGPRNEHRFSFQDLMLLRTAVSLQQASIPPRKILRSLAKLKSELPAELPLTGLRITAVGADVAVRDRAGAWHADSGQLLMDFEVAEVAGSVSFIPATTSRKLSPSVDWFDRGQALEATDVEAAEAAYRRAIELDPLRAAPYLNLGAILCEANRFGEALDLYDRAVKAVDGEPLIHFNHAIALEDAERPEEAIAAYHRALAIDPAMADAHYNLGILLERRGDSQGALRHFSAYRRLQAGKGA